MALSQSVGAGLTRGHMCGWREYKGDGLHRRHGQCESPFSDSYKAIKDIPIAMVATAWDDPATGKVSVLYIQ
jgi:hypothetical protein